MTTTPRCSVVIPVFEMATIVGEALDSCADQKITGLEVIVVDDGSRDDSARVAAAHPLRPTVISIDHTGIPGAVRNVGVLAAAGRHIQFLDADDLIAPGKLAMQLDALTDRPPDTVAYCDYAFFRDIDGRRVLERRGPDDGEYWPHDLQGQFGLYSVLHRFLFPRETLVRAGLFDPGLTHAEDLDLWLRLVIAGVPFVYQSQQLALYREHVSHSLGSPEGERLSRLTVARKLRGYLASRGVYERYVDVVDSIERAEAMALAEWRRSADASS